MSEKQSVFEVKLTNGAVHRYTNEGIEPSFGDNGLKVWSRGDGTIALYATGEWKYARHTMSDTTEDTEPKKAGARAL